MSTIPTDSKVLEPPPPGAIVKRQPISLAAAERAAKDAGFSLVDAKSLRAAGLLGEFISEVGAIHLGRSRLAVNVARADKAMDFLEAKLPDMADSESMIGVAKVLATFLGESNNSAELLIKSAQQAAETAKVEASTVLPGFAPRTSAGPQTQVNVMVRTDKQTEVKTTEDTIEG